MRALNWFSKMLRDERGQSTTEYILILSVVVLVAMKFKGLFNSKVTALVDKTFSEMDKDN